MSRRALLQPLFHSRVGRRLLLRFMLAALLPVTGVAVFAYFQVGHLLLDLNYRRLQQDSRALGMSFLGNFHVLAESLEHEAERIAHRNAPPEDVHNGFTRLTVHSLAEMPLTPDERHQLEKMAPVLRLEMRGTALLVGLPGRARVLQGRLDGKTIWGGEAVPEHYCVLGADYTPFICTPGLSAPSPLDWPRLLAGRHQGVFDWTMATPEGETAYLAAFWRARTQASYASPGFIVMVADPKAQALKGLTHFRVIFPALVVAALALALLLSINQIRRQLRPLEQLSAGTRRLESGDFDTPVRAEGDDEFAELAGAFNRMSAGLRHKFHMLKMLAELDRAILGASAMDFVVRSVLTHLRAAIPCDAAGLLRLAGSETTFFAAISPPDTGRPLAGTLPPLSEDRTGLRIALDSPEAAALRAVFPPPLSELLLFPSRVNGRLDSLLLLAYERLPDDHEEILAAGVSVADRLSVAASNFAWEEKLYHQAHYDALTDLPNRALLRDRVDQALMRADRDRTAVALMLLDLDNFKSVNDSLGHSAGDTLLIECAQRLKTHMRQSDTVVRLGGDEFIVLLPDLPRGGEAATLDTLARKLNAHLAQPFTLAERQITTPVSIGIALYPGNAGGYEDLLKMADAAMYESKRQQRGSYRFYSAEMNIEAHVRFELAQDLRAAIAAGELTLHYQPKIDLASGRMVGVEALVRWHSRKRGTVFPGVFVPVISEIGMEDWLTDWVMETVCAQLAAWDAAGLIPISVSLNLTPGNFERMDLLPLVRERLTRHGLAPDRLELEILETTAVNPSPRIHELLQALRELGVGIALDDFGTGYSSLVYLTRLPANILKLDRAFIADLVGNPRQQGIVERIIALAKTLDFRVVAEGVEDEAQRDLLAGMGCDWIQGYLTSPPLPAEALFKFWREGRLP